jgi:hypothetical protein
MIAHLGTLDFVTARENPSCQFLTRSAIRSFACPSAAASTIPARNARAALTVDDRVNRGSWPRSPDRNANAGAARFAVSMIPIIVPFKN